MQYSEAEIGTEVILGQHDSLDGVSLYNFCPDMTNYVGKKAKITSIHKAMLYDYAYVDVDEGRYQWHIKNMRLVNESLNINKPAVCTECGTQNEYVPYKKDYVCKSCLSYREMIG